MEKAAKAIEGSPLTQAFADALRGDGITAPALHRRVFYDVRLKEIDLRDDYVMIIGIVMERGIDKDIEEMIRFYGPDRVFRTLKRELRDLSEYGILRVCEYFKLRREELRCFVKPAWRQGHQL